MFLATTLIGITTIIALLVGPILAVRSQSKLNKQDEIRQEKVNVFKALMETRANTLSHRHVAALNSISTVFYGDSTVISAFEAYLAHLNIDTNAGKTKSEERSAEETRNWCARQTDLLADLLQKMGQELGYKFDINQLKQGAYMPVAHGNLEDELTKLRRLFIAIAEGQLPISVRMNYSDAQLADQKTFVDNLNAILTGNKPILVQASTDKSQQTTPALEEA